MRMGLASEIRTVDHDFSMIRHTLNVALIGWNSRRLIPSRRRMTADIGSPAVSVILAELLKSYNESFMMVVYLYG
jgi:hypothetical protein